MNEKIELTYSQNGDYLIPDLTLEEADGMPIGKYGMLRETYLKEHRSGKYMTMLLTGKLQSHLQEIDQTAQQRVDLIVERLAEKNQVNEEMKAQDQMKWVGLMNNFKNEAEEIVLTELVYS